MNQKIVKNRSEEFSELLKKTNKEHPRKKDVAAFRKLINSDPKFYASILPLAGLTTDSIVTQVVDSPGAQELLRVYVISIREELGYSEAPPFERALIDHIALCWLILHLAEQLYSQKTLKGSHAFNELLYFEKRLTSAQERYLRSIETLAKIRRLTRGLMVVNVAAPGGQQQVNQLFQNT